MLGRLLFSKESLAVFHRRGQVSYELIGDLRV